MLGNIKYLIRRGRQRSPVDDPLGFLPVGIHHVGDAGDFGCLLGEGHQVVATDSRDPEVAAAGHELLQTDLQLIGKGVEADGSQGQLLDRLAVLVPQRLVGDKDLLNRVAELGDGCREIDATSLSQMPMFLPTMPGIMSARPMHTAFT